MDTQLSWLFSWTNLSGIDYGITGVAVIIFVSAILLQDRKLDAIPTVGYGGGRLGPWWASFRNATNIAKVIQEGYEKHKFAPFKIAGLYHWIVIVSAREHVEELSRAANDILSLNEARQEQLNTAYTMGGSISDSPYHIAVIRSQLTRNVAKLCSNMSNEMVTAVDEVLDLRDNEWKSVPLLSALQKVSARVTNRVFVGLPLCRDPDWIELNSQWATDVIKEGVAIARFPKFIRPLAAYFCTAGTRRGRNLSQELIGPMIEERLACWNEYGSEWDAKPNDLLSWFMEDAQAAQLNTSFLLSNVMAVNFTTINTSSATMTNILLYLAAFPQHIQPLREEVETTIAKHGWSKESLGKMHKMDSFLRECQRIQGNNFLGLVRKAMKDFTFSDGTFIPKGTLLGVPTRSLNHDEKFYENPNGFEPFRFVDTGNEGDRGVKRRFTSTAFDDLNFGLGKHACPGRFFIVTVMKCMLAYVVMNYDIKMEDGPTGSHNSSLGTMLAANPRAKVLFRKKVE